MDQAVRKKLVEEALAARENAYVPHSGYPVGAALLTSDGTVFRGVNVENASYGLAICAERSAIAAAVTDGHRVFQAIAIATENGGSPCGACRQVLAEFNPDLPVLLVSSQQPDRIVEKDMSTLLPDQFEFRGNRKS